MSGTLIKASLTCGLAIILTGIAQGQQTGPAQNDAATAPLPRPMKRMKGMPGDIGAALGALNLTDEQKGQIRAIMERNTANTKAQRQQLRALREKQQQGALSADDQARAKTLRAELRQSYTSMRDEIMAVLTPEQRAQFEQATREQRRGRGRGRRDPGAPSNGSNQNTPPE
jgi:Spy/CpxP family protein refolding chaperone